MQVKNLQSEHTEDFFFQQRKLFKLQPVLTTFTCVHSRWAWKRSTAMTLVPIAPPGGRGQPYPECSWSPLSWFVVDKPHEGEKPLKWSRCSKQAEAFPLRPLPVVALASLVTQLITLGLRRFIALHSNCTNAPDSQTAFMAALLRQRGGCPVIRDGIPARSKGCARQGRTMAERGNHKLQPLSLRLWPFWLSYMNANALRLAPINTVITTANMATLAKGDCCWNSVSKANQWNDNLLTQTTEREGDSEKQIKKQSVQAEMLNVWQQ